MVKRPRSFFNNRLKLYSEFDKEPGTTKYIGAFLDVSKNKGCEINLYFDLVCRLAFNMVYLTKCDHAGFRLEVCLFGLELEIDFYDSRHWNKEANRWYLPGEEEQSKISYGNVNLND